MERFSDQESLDELAPPRKRSALRSAPDKAHPPFDYRAVDDAEEAPFDQAELDRYLLKYDEKEEWTTDEENNDSEKQPPNFT